jgi:hypothetical protein
MTLVLAPAVSEISNAVVKLQNQELIVFQQKHVIDTLKNDLIGMFGLMSSNEFVENGNDCYAESNLGVKHERIVEHIHGQGSFSKHCYHDLCAEDQRDAVKQIAWFAVHVVAGCDRVKAERDSDNNASEHDAPPVLPIQLVKMAPCKFISDVLDVYRPRLLQYWSEDKVDLIEQQQRELIRRFNGEQHVKQIAELYKETKSFNEAGDKLSIPSEELRQFCGGLATAFPHTTSVESDFSILKWEMDQSRSGLTDLSLEGIFQAKQLDDIPLP